MGIPDRCSDSIYRASRSPTQLCPQSILGAVVAANFITIPNYRSVVVCLLSVYDLWRNSSKIIAKNLSTHAPEMAARTCRKMGWLVSVRFIFPHLSLGRIVESGEYGLFI